MDGGVSDAAGTGGVSDAAGAGGAATGRVLRERDVPVEGGTLRVAEYGPADGPVLLAIHGITSSSRAFPALAALLPEVRIVAPDLRGRARSSALGEPFGLRQHAADLRRVLADLGVGTDAGPASIPVLGHSMGAFVAALLAAAEPERVSRLVLVDGGLPLEPPPGVDPQTLLDADPAALLGPVYERLTRVFPTEEDYVALWHAHPALGEVDPEEVAAYARYDAEPVEGGVRASARPDAVAADQKELFGPDWYRAELRRIRQPAVVLRAPLGLQAEPPGLYAPGVLETRRADLPQLEIVEVAHVNHYTIVMTSPDADRVAAAVQAALT